MSYRAASGGLSDAHLDVHSRLVQQDDQRIQAEFVDLPPQQVIQSR